MSELPIPFVYQNYGSDGIVSKKHTTLVSPPGSGKTRMIIMAMVKAGLLKFEDMPEGPILIVCSGPAVQQWIAELTKWVAWPILSDIHVVLGKPEKRAQMWATAHDNEYGIFITNPAIFRQDFNQICPKINKPQVWSIAIGDEYHKFMLRHSKNQSFAKWKRLTNKMFMSVTASGTVYAKNPSSMFTAFHLTDRHLFASYWKFVNTWCNVVEGYFGKEVLGPKNVAEFQKVIDRHLVYIPEAVVADELPNGLRSTVTVQASAPQRQVYDALVEDLMAEIGESLIVAPNVLARQTKLRQLLCCPKILDPSLGMGSAFEYVLDQLSEEDHHCMIFVPYRAACTYVQEELTTQGYKTQILRGGTEQEAQRDILAKFKETRSIIVCTIAYAEAFDAESCCTSYFMGQDTLRQCRQAEGRTQRAHSKHKFVKWIYIKHQDTLEEQKILDMSMELRDSDRVFRRPKEFIDMLRGVAR